jgi:hypothetical protein
MKITKVESCTLILTKMTWARVWAILSQSHPVTVSRIIIMCFKQIPFIWVARQFSKGYTNKRFLNVKNKRFFSGKLISAAKPMELINITYTYVVVIDAYIV